MSAVEVCDLPDQASALSHGIVGVLVVLGDQGDELDDERHGRLHELHVGGGSVAVALQALDDAGVRLQHALSKLAQVFDHFVLFSLAKRRKPIHIPAFNPLSAISGEGILFVFTPLFCFP